MIHHFCVLRKEVSLFMLYSSNDKPCISIATPSGSLLCLALVCITEQLQHCFHLHANKAY